MSTSLISVVIPAHDTEDYVGACVRSVLDAAPGVALEVIVVDDGSGDATARRAQEAIGDDPRGRVVANATPGGPGAGRNSGLDVAVGEWVLFVDSDDTLVPLALDVLARHLRSVDPGTDIVAFDWMDHPESMDERSSTRTFGRRDLDDLAAGDRMALVDRYLRFLIDPSVIYLALRRDLLERLGLRFRDGLHEDFDFTLACLLGAGGIEVLRETVVQKRARPGSVVNSISPAHLGGFAGAWRESVRRARAYAPDDPRLDEAVRAGRVAVIATRAREVVRHSPDDALADPLFAALLDEFDEEIAAIAADPPTGSTVYEMIARDVVEAARTSPNGLAARIRSLSRKTWSCQDLHGSVFLRPDEVRTCCKRFFVDGEMHGDVVLLDVSADRQPSPDDVLRAKQDLHRRINAGAATPCSGCPFLSLDEWGPIEPLHIRYLSMEQHSVCNFRCTYCSDEYFGGAKPRYDVQDLVTALGDAGALDGCEIVVWGGGEPTVAKDFEPMTRYLAERAPGATQRFLTNATRFSPAIAAGLADGTAQVVTSIDAGTREVFAAVRGRDRLDDVITTLESYAGINARRVTVKYIFTDGNSSRDQVGAFVDLIAASGLLRCFFQISADFKHEAVTFDVLAAAVEMFSGLRAAGVDHVYLDELFRQRLNDESLAPLAEAAADEGWSLAMVDPAAVDSVAVWGAGQATRLLLGTGFMDRVPLAHLVDANPAVQGTTVGGVVVESPSVLLTSDCPVILSAVQGMPLMVEQAEALGIARERILRDLVI